MAINLTVGGGTAQLGVQGLPISDFTLRSVDSNVVTVSTSGVVTPVSAGLAAVVVKRKSNGKEHKVLFRVKDLDKVLIPVINNQVYGVEADVALPPETPVEQAGYGVGGYGMGGYGA